LIRRVEGVLVVDTTVAPGLNRWSIGGIGGIGDDII
jgi:hypothetical protein